MKWLLVVLLLLPVMVLGTSNGTNCLKGSFPDFITLSKPMIALSYAYNPESGYTCHMDSIFYRAAGNGEALEIYFYYRHWDGSAYDCGQLYGPFTDTVVGTGEQDMYTIIDTEFDTTEYAYTVLFNCIDDPNIESFDPDEAGFSTYIETSDADCSANAGYANIAANEHEGVLFCLYYTLTPVPTGGQGKRRRALLISEKEDEPEKIQMVYCSADGSATRL